jgi:hypothetical protein
MTNFERFNQRIDTSGDHWKWTGRIHADGYGMFDVYGKPMLSHRFAYEAYVGPIPDGLEIDHLCRVRDCCRPEHLEAVAHAENIRRGRTGYHNGPRGVFQKSITHCPAGHDYATQGYLTPRGSRNCRTCCVQRTREWRARNRQ